MPRKTVADRLSTKAYMDGWSAYESGKSPDPPVRLRNKRIKGTRYTTHDYYQGGYDDAEDCTQFLKERENRK